MSEVLYISVCSSQARRSKKKYVSLVQQHHQHHHLHNNVFSFVDFLGMYFCSQIFCVVFLFTFCYYFFRFFFLYDNNTEKWHSLHADRPTQCSACVVLVECVLFTSLGPMEYPECLRVCVCVRHATHRLLPLLTSYTSTMSRATASNENSCTRTDILHERGYTD